MGLSGRQGRWDRRIGGLARTFGRTGPGARLGARSHPRTDRPGRIPMRRLSLAAVIAVLVALTAADAMASALDSGSDRPIRKRWDRSPRTTGSSGVKDLTIVR